MEQIGTHIRRDIVDIRGRRKVFVGEVHDFRDPYRQSEVSRRGLGEAESSRNQAWLGFDECFSLNRVSEIDPAGGRMRPGKANHQELQRKKESATSTRTVFKRRNWLGRVEAPLIKATFFESPGGFQTWEGVVEGTSEHGKYSLPTVDMQSRRTRRKVCGGIKPVGVGWTYLDRFHR